MNDHAEDSSGRDVKALNLHAPEPVPSSRREAAKDERRKRIIDAAREMIRESGSTGLSMRALSKRAGVSLATPYNLFGSRGAVMIAVLQDLRDFVGRYAALTETDPVDRIIAVVNLHLEYCLSDTIFYTTLWREAYNNVDDVRDALLNPDRTEFWLHLIDDAARKDVFIEHLNTEQLFSQLDHHFRSIMMEWSTGMLPNRLFVPTMRYGYAVVLAGAANSQYRSRLHKIMLKCQDAIEQWEAAREEGQDPST